MEKVITLAGGCFWGTEKFLSYIEGVVLTEVGYANGHTKNPSYKEVCTGQTGYVEAVGVVYDTDKISLGYLLEVFYQAIDPTLLNRQGGDKGTQYRTGVYYEGKEDKDIIEQSLTVLHDRVGKPIIVECVPLDSYSSAEQYHQKYLDKNPEGYCHIGAHEFEIARKAKDPSLL